MAVATVADEGADKIKVASLVQVYRISSEFVSVYSLFFICDMKLEWNIQI